MSDPFDFDHFIALPRLGGLRLSPDGRRLVVGVSLPHADGKRMASSIWAVDPEGEAPPRRLTRSAKGESNAEFLPDGSLLFTSARPDPDAKPEPDGEPTGALWLLPADGGEARLLAAPKAGVAGIRVARDAGTVLITSALFPSAGASAAPAGQPQADADEPKSEAHEPKSDGAQPTTDAEEPRSVLAIDAEREQARRDAGVGALLFDDFPIRFWDHYLGPREPHLLAADPPAEPEGRLTGVRDVTPDAGLALVDAGADITPDGATIVSAWHDSSEGYQLERSNLVVIDRSTGVRRQLTHGDWYDRPVVSPDGRRAAAVHVSFATPDLAPTVRLHLVDLASGEVRELTADLDRWPHDPVWAPDGSAVFFHADDDGRSAPWRVEVGSGEVTRLATDGSYADLCPSPDGATVYALRSTVDRPPHVVRLAATGADQAATEVPSPATPEVGLPRRGRLERVEARAADGTPIRSWLVLPEGASVEHPAPLVVFVHGGPIGSWGGWHWRWNPHLLAERGYAVLLPDPAISTGYGRDFVQRGWGRWGAAPFTDVIAAVDGALERPEIDADRTALMGGSFGGYMANWVAGRTDRFRCIVTHASLWELRGFHGVTDHGPSWEQEFGDPYVDASRYRENDPSASVGSIRTPMLVIHGELDHRVPISEALKLWTDLRRNGVPGRFLYFPDENHWILKPQNARIWYATVLAFLDEHVLGRDFARPDLL